MLIFYRFEQTFLSSFAAKFSSDVSFYLNIVIAPRYRGLGFFEAQPQNQSLSPTQLAFTNWDNFEPKINFHINRSGKN